MQTSIEFMDVLDENGNVTGKIKTRDKITRDKDFYKIVNLWLINPTTKQILLQKRSKNKESHPNKWDLTSGGEDLTLQADEVSDARYFSLKELITAHNTNDIHFIKHSFFPELATYMKEKIEEIKK